MAEENRKKLAEATLTELELTDDLSDSQSELLDTVTQLATSTKADDTLRVSEWINNSPVATASHPTNTAVLDPNTVTVTTAAPKSVNMGAPTTTPSPSIPVVTSVTPPTSPTTNDMPSGTGLSSLVYLPTTGPVQNPQQTTTSPGTSSLITATVQPTPTFTVPASHLLPNLSAWTFPQDQATRMLAQLL